MADIPAQVDRVVPTNRAWLGGQWLSLSEHLSALIDDIPTLPAHANDRSGGEELAQTMEVIRYMSGSVCPTNRENIGAYDLRRVERLFG